MARFGFCGPSYLGITPAWDGERSVNLYPSRIESGHGKSDYYLQGTPGRKLFATLPKSPVRGLWGGDNRLFAVGGDTLYEISPTGVPTAVPGTLNNASTPATILSNGNQLLVVSGAQAFCTTFQGGTQQLVAVDTNGLGLGCVGAAYVDGYFIAQAGNSNQFNVSAPLDGTTWTNSDGSFNFATKDGAPDRLSMIFADHELLWLFGEKTIEVWYNAGLPLFPFTRIQGAFIEQGLWAPFSPARVDNTLMWLGGDERGTRVVWRAQGFLPIRVSNHAMEQRIQQYANSFDAIGYSYQESGHQFYILHFPTANATWGYDAATGQWHERGFWNALANPPQYQADIARYHADSEGVHYVGDYRNGNIYTQSEQLFSDNGVAIRRLRRAPHISNELKWQKYTRFVVDMQFAQGPQSGQGSIPTAMMRFSDDGGFTWSNERQMGAAPLKVGMGQSLFQAGIGEYKYRYVARRLGRSRDRVFELAISDPVQIAIVDAYLDGVPGNGA